jgi:type I restriction enzyme S subunit
VNAGDWRVVRLGDVCTYSTAKVSITEINEDNYISTENMLPNKNGVVKSSGLPTVASVTRYFTGNVLVSNIRPYFKKIWCADREGGCSNDVLVFVVKDKRILDSRFLFYCLSNDEFFNYVMAGAKGTKMPRGDKGAILKYPVHLPTLSEQKAIAATLSALDDMIELNNQINKTLEEMAQAIFKSWFVDFEPFKNGEFEESELGLIPKGWRVGAIDELIKETISGDWGKETPQGNYTEKVICIRGADIPDIAQGRRGNPATRYILKRNLEKKRLSENEIIIEISGGSPTQSTGRTVFITKELINSFQEPIICTNFCRTVRLKEATYSSFVYSLLQYLYNEKVFFTYENGTTGIKNLDITTLFGQYKTVIPSEEVFAEYHSMYSEFLRYIYESGFECKKLSEIRDTLLPKLISGEIRVPVEEVV